MKFEIGKLPAKLADTKYFMRIAEDGNLQFIRIEPLFNDDGILIPVSVVMHVDNDAPFIMDRWVAEMMAEAYIPLTTWKNQVN